jgi:hypothetical protein
MQTNSIETAMQDMIEQMSKLNSVMSSSNILLSTIIDMLKDAISLGSREALIDIVETLEKQREALSLAIAHSTPAQETPNPAG